MNANDIAQRLVSLGFPVTAPELYREPHRHYHNEKHLLDVLGFLEQRAQLSDELFLAAVYHDAVYDPRRNDNEEMSAKLFRHDAAAAKLDRSATERIAGMILDTKSHKASHAVSQPLLDADLNILDRPLDELIAYENGIFREYQFARTNEYRKRRLEVLARLNTNGRLDTLIEYVKHHKPLVGVFCGSFNPFHKGHYNILQKAEKIFDKVIIAFGHNPDKQERTWEIPRMIRNRQIEHYSGLLTDFVSSLQEDVIVVRGLRNSTDFQYEQNQYRYIQELMPEIRIVNIFCDKEFEHISSSGIRTLEKFNKHRNYLLE